MEISADTILDYLSNATQAKKMLSPEFYLEASIKLLTLLGEETNKLEDLRMTVAKMKLQIFESQEKRNVSEAKLRIEATQEYADYRKQDAKCERIVEIIRVAKKLAEANRIY